MRMEREFYLPRESNGASNITKAVTGDGSEIYTYTDKLGRPYAMVFRPKASNPDWHYSFKSCEARDKRVAQFIEARTAHVKAVSERRSRGPSETTQRNAALKKLLENAFGKGKVRVVGHTGTSYGWVTVKIAYTPRDVAERQRLESEIWRLINKAGIKIGTYGYDDPGSDYGYGRTIHFRFGD